MDETVPASSHEPTLAARLKADVAAAEAGRVDSPIQRVQIVDVSIPFGSMVALLINIALASIPAAIMIAVIGFAIVAFIGGLGALSTFGR